MKVIGIVGRIGSGKDTISDYIAKKYGYRIIVMGDIVREIATEMGRGHSRDELQQTQKDVVARHGIDYFAKRVVEKIRKNNWQKVVINGIRRPEDASVPKAEFGKDMVVMLVDTSTEIRFGRMKLRSRAGDPKTLEEFLRQEENEKKFFRWNETKKYIDGVIVNNNSVDDLYRRIDEFIKKKGME